MTCHGRIPEVRSQFMSGFIGWLLVAAAEDVQVMIQQVCRTATQRHAPLSEG